MLSETIHGPIADVRMIEEQLANLRWRMRPDGEIGDEAAEHAAAESRASVLTLVAVAQTTRQQGEIAQVLNEMAVYHPSRTLILLAQQERESLKLEATVSASLDTSAGRRITNEQVLLHAHGPVAEHLASIVAPLVLPDLPVMLWWPGRPHFHSRLFRELVDLCDRLIIDTEEDFDPQRDFDSLLEVAHRPHARAAIGDFNWARLLPWRQLTAQFFDPLTMRPWLRAIERIEISCGDTGSHARSILLAAWLRARLKPLDVQPPVRLIPEPGPVGTHRLSLLASQAGDQARFCIVSRPPDTVETELQIGSQSYPGRTVRKATRSTAELLAMELVETKEDPYYEEAVAEAIALS
jgi:glucose-6-phosphate dehydrogenase assembly protein OpcA